MKIDKTQVRKRFNRAVATFDTYATLHRKMAQRLLLSLQKQGSSPNRILEIGCGTGYFTQLLVDFYPNAEITAVDFAEKMIHVAKENMGSIDHVQFILDDAEEWVKNDKKSYDLIVSNATLHLLQRPEETVRYCMQRLNPSGWMAASTFGPDTIQEFIILFAQVCEEIGLTPSRPIMDFRTQLQWEHLLRDVKSDQIQIEEYWKRLEYDDCRHFLRSVRSTGHSYNEVDQNIFVVHQILDQVIKKYNLAYQSKKGVYATYHMMQILAQKSPTNFVTSSW